MAGHSKWANTKHRKAAVDAKRGKLFTRLLKEVAVAARMGGGDPAGNPRLRTAVDDARSKNVPNDNIERAIKRGTGELEGVDYEEITYEGYGPGGVAILVEAMTDNKNRTVGELRHTFSRYGGNLGETNCVAWMFDRKGLFAFAPDSMDEEAFMELALELEVDDVTIDEDGYSILTSFEDYNRVRDALAEREGIEPTVKQVAMIPQTEVAVEAGEAGTLLKLLEALEDNDDTQNVWANCDIDESVLESVN